jgi:hypothetical protein
MALITLGANSGKGKVLQVVTGTLTSETTTSSSTFVDTGLDVLITPSSTSSKIFITSSISTFNEATARSMYWTLYRDSTNLGNNAGFFSTYHAGGSAGSSGALSFLDTPSTTSQIEYSVYFRRDNSGTAYISTHGSTNTITAMEIQG